MGGAGAAVATRVAEPRDVEAIGRICDAGYRHVAQRLLPGRVVDRLAARFYAEAAVARALGPGPSGDGWQGYVVAEVGDRVVGAAGGGLDGEGEGRLHVLYLDLALLRGGIGSALVARVTEQQRDLGARRQRVACLARNDGGLAFYGALGFVEESRRPYPDGDPDAVPEVVLTRRI